MCGDDVENEARLSDQEAFEERTVRTPCGKQALQGRASDRQGIDVSISGYLIAAGGGGHKNSDLGTFGIFEFFSIVNIIFFHFYQVNSLFLHQSF